jgi:hypothetical protein
MNTIKLTHPVSFLLAALIGLGVGACKQSELRIETVCKRQCSRVADCSDVIDYDECVSDCVDKSDECDSDKDTEQALDKLEQCPDKACGQVLGCAAEAWVECTF